MYRPTLFSNPADHADRTIPAQAEAARTTTPRVFAARCAFRPDGKLARKEEREGPHRTAFGYEYDADGRLTQVSRDGVIVERYLYNAKGQRTAALYPALGRACEFAYDAHGRLLRAGDVAYAWSPKGSLARREIGGFRTLYHYGNNTRLDALILPDRRRIRYKYGDGLMPVRILCDNRPAVEYLWEDPVRLRACRDLRSGDVWSFSYAGGRIPTAAILEGPIARAYGADRLRLAVHADQVGSIRLLTLPDGRVLKRLEYDSFGNILDDTPEELCFPFGFAGGLLEPFSGLTRFGFRDYDPEAGRFTAKDPLGDTGGDHDLYDYCVDDPVSMNDPSGLKGSTIGKFVLKGILRGFGRSLGGLGLLDFAFPDATNAAEEMVDVELKIRKIKDKSQNGTISNSDQRAIKSLQKRQEELFNEYPDIYEKNHDYFDIYKIYK